MKINYETVHFNNADRIGNLTAEAVGVVKGEKHFPVYSGNRIFKPLSKSKPFSTPLFAYAEVFWSNVINEYFVKSHHFEMDCLISHIYYPGNLWPFSRYIP